MAKEILKPNVVNAPTLFVGVGGTGGKVVKRVAQMCRPEEKVNVNFVCLDTNVNDLNNVAGSGMYHVQTSSTQTVGDYLTYDRDALKNWFPKNAVIYDKTVSEGAGQVRAISRLALNACIKTGKIMPLYNAIDDLFRKDGKEMKQAMRVVLVSTASGGTGSGIMTPLAMFIRDYVSNKYPNTSLIVRSLVLLPETLDSVITSASERESQRRNAYATIKEINAFMMKGSGFFDVDEDLKRYRDLTVDFSVAGTGEMKKLGLLPFDFCFLLDGQNAEDSTLINVGQYIEQAARALYQQNIGPMQKDAFSMEDNIIKEMSAPGMYGRNRFGGIGAGTLRYPYEEVADFIAFDWAMDAIGGEGEAAKWTKYDKAYEDTIRACRKKGMAESEWPTRGQVYTSKVDSSRDNFSRNLKSYYLSEAEDKVEEFFSALVREMHASVNGNAAIQGCQNGANHLAMEIDYKEPDNRGKAKENKERLRDYESAVRGNARKAAANVAESIFQSETKTINGKLEFTLEYLMKTPAGEVIHPNAMRYLLYLVKAEMDDRIQTTSAQLGDLVAGLELFSPEADDPATFDAGFSKGKERNLDELCEAEKGEGQDPGFFEKLSGYEKIYDTLNNCFPQYFQTIKEYSEKLAELEAYKVGAEYVGELCKMFEKFYRGFGEKVTALIRKQDDLVDSLRFQKGDSVLNVCASREMLQELCHTARSAGEEGSMLDSDLNGRIFDAVKANVTFEREIRNADVVEEDRRIDIFDQILLGYFRDSVRRDCEAIDVNIVEAIAMENRLLARIKAREAQGNGEPVFDKVTPEDTERYVRQIMATGRRLAAPGIQRIRSEEAREIVLCAYNKSLDNMRALRMNTLVPKGTSAAGVDTVSRYELHFFNALYNLTPDKLDKFASPDESETRSKNAGLYHDAYVNYSRNIGPDSTKGSIISTHIDKRWDSIAVMPELDFGFQAKQIMKIHQALIYGLIYRKITFRSLSNAAQNKRVYKYENSDERYVDLTVSNGTLCDEFYEILDALYISSSIVEDIGVVRARKQKRDMTRKSNYVDTVFAKELKEFQLDCVHEGPTSLFEIPLAYYNTLPNSQRYTSELSALVDAVIKTFRDELETWESVNDVKFLLCNILKEQFLLLMANYGKYEQLNCGVDPRDNMVLDIIFRKIRSVVETTPEPDDYEELISGMRKAIG
ncbi:MAG: hypothetical protein IIV61_02500 [Oscillospiraceae bacterium]|nr:hypothetical protein [Oscillospiraceae bacterium]